MYNKANEHTRVTWPDKDHFLIFKSLFWVTKFWYIKYFIKKCSPPEFFFFRKKVFAPNFFFEKTIHPTFFFQKKCSPPFSAQSYSCFRSHSEIYMIYDTLCKGWFALYRWSRPGPGYPINYDSSLTYCFRFLVKIVTFISSLVWIENTKYGWKTRYIIMFTIHIFPTAYTADSGQRKRDVSLQRQFSVILSSTYFLINF